MKQAASSSAPSAGPREDETVDDGWVLLDAGGSSDTAAGARPPLRGGNRPPAGAPTPFDPAPDDLVGRYLPARRALRCGDLPPRWCGAGEPSTRVTMARRSRGGRVLGSTCRRRATGASRTAKAGNWATGACVRYREDDEQVWRTSRTVWSMEEYGFGPDFPYGEHGGDQELVVYKVYQRMARQQDA